MKTAREIIENYDGPDVRIMEVCGTHTHEIFRLGIRKLLPKQVELISGPGCPVCVTPVSFIDEAIYLALEKGVTICTFGDLVRVPGTNMSLAGVREQGAKIHVVYSPADAEKYAGEHPDEQVTFLSVGFETTTPAGCLSVKAAREDGLDNYSILVANKTMPQAYEALKDSADVFFISGTCQCHYGNTSLRSSDRRRGQRCCGRIYGKRTDDSTGGCAGKIPGRKAIFCKLLSASGDTGWKQGGTAACR